MIQPATNQISKDNLSRHAIIALGGGGARGLAHLGALQAIEEAGIVIDRIVGVSIGSLVGAMSATGQTSHSATQHVLAYVTSRRFRTKQNALFGAHPKNSLTTGGMIAWYDRIRAYLWARQLLNRVFRRRSLLCGQVLEEVISHLIPDVDIAELPIPLSIVTIDLLTGHQVVLERGSIRKAIAASAAIPGIFPPVEWNGMLLCDVGVLDSLPVRMARSYATDQLVIGIDVGPTLEPISKCDSAIHVLLRMDEIAERLYRRVQIEEVDLLIKPEVGHIQWFDFCQPSRTVDLGRHAARLAINRFAQACHIDISEMLSFSNQ
ncbi:MAG: patatin-like phospholipase family protein [Planctomycetales bacterium]|nr:patatin-like phospholipase family protein [Planctomycetales bacterium]